MSSATIFVDESHYTEGRYRSIAAVTVRDARLDVRDALRHPIALSKHSEIKFANLNSADARNSALAMFDVLNPDLVAGNMRIDVLDWDTYDTRSTVPGRKVT